jgi:DNA-directed RNA polymerase subunit RPC12/RpoP
MAEPKLTEEIELICPHCGYRTARTPDRLRRQTEVVCANCGRVILPEGGER